MLASGMPEWQADALLDLQAYYLSGKGGKIDGLLEQLLGHPPITMDQFLADFAGEFRAEPEAPASVPAEAKPQTKAKPQTEAASA